NSCLSNTYACVLMALRVTVADDIPGNAGMYRALRMSVPEGSILNPVYPAAVSAATQVSYHTFEALMRAFAPLAGERLLADTGGGGRRRGGLGLRRAFYMKVPVRCAFQISMPSKSPAGLAGGEAGSPTRATIIGRNGSRRSILEFSECSIDAGDVVIIETAGGG